MESIKEESVERVKVGRPKTVCVSKEEYRKEYYKNNKDKWEGDKLCPTCNLIFSKVNSSRHNKSKVHLKNLISLIK